MLEKVSRHAKTYNGITKKKNNAGYIFIKVGLNWIPEHRLVCEEIIGRELTNQEVIHHIDLNKENNEPSNLALFESQKAHSHWHRQFNQFHWTNPLRRAINERRICNFKVMA